MYWPVAKAISVKDISIFISGLAILFSLMNILINFDRRHHEEYFCEIILNLDQWFKRCCLKIFLNYISGSPFVWHSQTICAILVEGIMRNISVK